MHDPVLHADHEDHHHDTGGTKQVGGMRHGVEKLHLDKVNIQQEDDIVGDYLDYVRNDDLEAPDYHHLGGGHPARGLGHQHAPHDPQGRLLAAEDPGGGCPVLEQRLGVDGKDADDRDDETSNSKPEHQH